MRVSNRGINFLDCLIRHLILGRYRTGFISQPMRKMSKKSSQPKEISFQRSKQEKHNQYFLEEHTSEIFAEVGGIIVKKSNSLCTKTQASEKSNFETR